MKLDFLYVLAASGIVIKEKAESLIFTLNEVVFLIFILYERSVLVGTSFC